MTEPLDCKERGRTVGTFIRSDFKKVLYCYTVKKSFDELCMNILYISILYPIGMPEASPCYDEPKHC